MASNEPELVDSAKTPGLTPTDSKVFRLIEDPPELHKLDTSLSPALGIKGISQIKTFAESISQHPDNSSIGFGLLGSSQQIFWLNNSGHAEPVTSILELLFSMSKLHVRSVPPPSTTPP